MTDGKTIHTESNYIDIYKIYDLWWPAIIDTIQQTEDIYEDIPRRKKYNRPVNLGAVYPKIKKHCKRTIHSITITRRTTKTTKQPVRFQGWRGKR